MNQQFKKVFACTAGPEYYEFCVAWRIFPGTGQREFYRI